MVERVTLRSTRIKGMNGETIWLNNQNIQGVRVTTKGLRTVAVELFVSDERVGERLVDEASLRIPHGPLMVVKPLSVMSINEVGHEGHNIWHITAIAQTAPGREWLIKKYTLEVLQNLDNSRKNPVLMSEPIARDADSAAEQKFAQAIKNARKTANRKSLTAQIHTAAQTRKAAMKERKQQKKIKKIM